MKVKSVREHPGMYIRRACVISAESYALAVEKAVLEEHKHLCCSAAFIITELLSRARSYQGTCPYLQVFHSSDWQRMWKGRKQPAWSPTQLWILMLWVFLSSTGSSWAKEASSLRDQYSKFHSLLVFMTSTLCTVSMFTPWQESCEKCTLPSNSFAKFCTQIFRSVREPKKVVV